jgi:hypothetical protein
LADAAVDGGGRAAARRPPTPHRDATLNIPRSNPPILTIALAKRVSKVVE